MKCGFLSGAKANKASWFEECVATTDDDPDKNNKATLKSETKAPMSGAARLPLDVPARRACP